MSTKTAARAEHANIDVTHETVRSADGTAIAYTSLGSGPGLIIVGGALAAGQHYRPLAEALAAASFRVHVIDRRGRGESGPQGAHYSVEKECEDLLAVQAATRASMVFGHSFGGLVALETAARHRVFPRIAVYEPGVPVGATARLGWIPRYRQLLAAGDRRGAFACFVRGSGFTPLSRLPLWYARMILRIAVRGAHWEQIEPLLESNLAEHEKLTQLASENIDRYGAIEAGVLLLGGSKSPPFASADVFEALAGVIPDTAIAIIDGAEHLSPTGKHALVIADAVASFLRTE
jgi:pimeloyl-ACP methyl ester carboxylesterase